MCPRLRSASVWPRPPLFPSHMGRRLEPRPGAQPHLALSRPRAAAQINGREIKALCACAWVFFIYFIFFNKAFWPFVDMHNTFLGH